MCQKITKVTRNTLGIHGIKFSVRTREVQFKSHLSCTTFSNLAQCGKTHNLLNLKIRSEVPFNTKENKKSHYPPSIHIFCTAMLVSPASHQSG